MSHFLLMLRVQFLFVRNFGGVEVNLHIWHSVTSLHKTAGWEWWSCQRLLVRLKAQKVGCAHKREPFHWQFGCWAEKNEDYGDAFGRNEKETQ